MCFCFCFVFISKTKLISALLDCPSGPAGIDQLGALRTPGSLVSVAFVLIDDTLRSALLPL